MTFLIRLSICLTVFAVNFRHFECIEITTKSGKIDALEKEILGKKIGIAYGVPYAEPPIGENRFGAPKKVKPWTGTKKCHDKPPMCMQLDPSSVMKAAKKDPKLKAKAEGFDMQKEVDKIIKEKGKLAGGMPAMINEYKELKQSEDCLVMNIFFPTDITKTSDKAVLMFLPGGFFIAGGASIASFDGRILSAFKNIIVVVVQYRLHVFGFLHAGTPEIPGNQGLRDQAMAIRWIYENAKSFGGDPKKITLFGADAGGWSAGMALFNKDIHCLIRRVIMASGCMLFPAMMFGENAAKSRCEKFIRASPCATTLGTKPGELLTKETYECLRKLTVDQINEAHNKVMASKKEVGFFPSEDSSPNGCLGGNPFDLYKKEQYECTKEMMVTTNSNEAGIMLASALYDTYPPLKGECKPVTLDQLVEKMKAHGGSNVGQVQMMLPMFFKNVDKNNPTQVRNRCMNLVSDGLFFCLDVRVLGAFIKKKNCAAYYIRFQNRPKNSIYAKWLKGSQHGDELQWFFGLPLKPEHKGAYTEKEIEISKDIMTFTANFAKYGDPSHNYHKKFGAIKGRHREHLLVTEKGCESHKGLPKSCCKDLSRYYDLARSMLKNYK